MVTPEEPRYRLQAKSRCAATGTTPAEASSCTELDRFAKREANTERSLLMPSNADDSCGLPDPRRRALLGAASSLAVTVLTAPALAQGATSQIATPAAPSRNSSLGGRLQGVQHFGVTVQNMNRAFEFYTEVLGGTEIMRDGDFQGERIHNTLLTDQELLARETKVNPRTIGVPDLKGGSQRLDVRFIQFDNAVIELLQYRDATQASGDGDSFAEPREHMSPAYPRSMHICFHVRDDVDFNQFIRDLEAECRRRNMPQVRANRVTTVTTEKERLAAPMSANTNKITAGKSNGWSLIYCKGPEGEQLEFVQALGPVKQIFEGALQARRRNAPATSQ
jgi:catechol 2,3-dioxygenase-like lactoylglutathione lyase family enzyme